MPVDFKKFDRTKSIVLLVAVAAGAAAVFLTNTYINKTIGESASQKELDLLTEKVQTLEQVNKDMMQQQAAYASRIEQELNNLSQGGAVGPGGEAAPGEKKQSSLALKTPEGKRAITANVETLAAVGGLLSPGDFVDVLVLLTLPTDQLSASDAAAALKNAQKTTVTLFQNVQILAIGANVDSPPDFNSQQKTAVLPITFALDPQQAEIMTFANTYGKLQLVLRGPEEDTAYRLPSANWDTFKEYLESTQGVSINSPIAPKGSSPAKTTPIEVYRGGAR